MADDFQRVMLELPPEYPYKESKLFEYVSFRKARKTQEVYRSKVKSFFVSNIRQGKPLFSSQSTSTFAKKNVVIKNIGNMKKAHLKNALEYTISHSDDQVGIDYLGEFVNVNDIMRDWEQDFSSNPNTNEALHLVFSLNESHSQSVLDTLTESARQTMQSYFPTYKWVMIPHSHQNKPHIHIILNKTDIFTKKKLHFGNKNDIAQFYEELREDFKYNLFTYSRGKLDYTNEVKFDKRFRQDMLDSKIDNLEKLQAIKEPNKELDFMANYKKAIFDFSNRHKGYSQKLNAVTKSLKNKNIYLGNVERKIESLMLQNINPTLLHQKQQLLQAQILEDTKEQERLKKALADLDSALRHFLDWEANFNTFSKNFQEKEKQKAFVKSFVGYEKYLSVELSQKLRDTQKAIAKSENSLKNKFSNVNEGVIKGLSNFNEKSNVFKLSSSYSKLIFYKGIISSIDFSDNQSLRDKKQKSIDELVMLEKQIIELMRIHLQKLPKQIEDSLSALESLKQDRTLDSMSFARAAVRLNKKINFYESSLKAIMRFQKRYGIELVSSAAISEKQNVARAKEQTQTKTSQEHIKPTNNALTQDSNQAIKQDDIKQDKQGASKGIDKDVSHTKKSSLSL